MIVYLLGFMGAGKSHLGRQLADATRSNYLDLDDLLVNKVGMTINRIFEQFGESYFRNLETEMLHEISLNIITSDKETESDHKRIYHFIGCGGGTPCYNNNMEWMNRHGLTIWLNPSIEVLFSRLRNEKHKRPLLRALDDEGLLNFIENKLAERKKFYELSVLEFNDNEISISNILSNLNNA